MGTTRTDDPSSTFVSFRSVVMLTGKAGPEDEGKEAGTAGNAVIPNSEVPPVVSVSPKDVVSMSGDGRVVPDRIDGLRMYT